MDDFERELKQGFLAEADQILTDLEQCFLAIESQPQDKAVLDKIFRLAHNLKGSSKAVGFDQLGAFTHEFENFLLKLKNGVLDVTPSAVSLLLKANDQIVMIIQGLREDLNARFDLQAQIQELEAASRGELAEPAHAEPEPVIDEPAVDVPVSDELSHDELLLAAAAFDSQEEAPAASVPIAELKPVALEEATPPPQMSAPSTPPASAPAPQASAQAARPSGGAGAPVADESIRVSLQRLEKLLNFVGEMSILQSVLFEQVYGTNPDLLRRTAHQMSKVSKEVQDIAMSLRMVPVRQTFQKMQRIVRDTANVLNKKVQLHLSGEDTELDKTVLESIGDPLVHLIRNAVDHGVESPEQRLAAGKPELGHVYLSAYHQAGKLVIEIRDDGGGISGQKLLNKAIEKGLVRPGTKMSENEAVRLIFLPGFSTKTQVSEVSGRGVGMDVVKTNIEALQGEVSIETEVGKFTCFKIALPLTMAIIDAMVVANGADRFVVPLSHVHESLKLESAHLHPATGMGEVIQLRGELLPAYRLSRLLNPQTKPTQSEQIALVIRNQGPPFSILVDDIVRQQQVVVKRLGRELQSRKGFSGSAILGDGKPALILEAVELLGGRQALVKGA